MAAALPPSFPKGLRVLLVDTDDSRSGVESQLRQQELQYAVTSCGSSTEAIVYSRTGVTAFDVVLAESDLVAMDDISGRAFIHAFEGTPVILMSENNGTDDVLRAVKMGAVDFLSKPLSLLKLKNIWQHHIRKMMQRTSLYDSSYPQQPAYSEPIPARPTQTLSGCLPSSMTAPMAPLSYVPDFDAMEGISSMKQTSTPDVTIGGGATNKAANRSSVDSPGTPCAAAGEPNDSLSAGSVGQPTTLDGISDPISSLDGPDRGSFESVDGGPSMESLSVAGSAAAAGAVHFRPPLACKPSSFGPLVPVPPVSQWPRLPSGCVWGTPLGGPIPPPLPQQQACGGLGGGDGTFLQLQCPPVPCAAACDAKPILIKKPAPLPVQPAPLTTNTVPVPEGFLSKDELSKAVQGPIGLRLRKSSSFLNLLNDTLTPNASTNISGGTGSHVGAFVVGVTA